jgi:glycosyltransferase involved in cell wall biosynthesis
LKILLLNTDDYTGGAAIACRRLLKALRINKDIIAQMIVQEGKSGQEAVVQLNNSWFDKKKAYLRFVAERLYFLFYEKNKAVRFSFNPAKFGTDLSHNQFVKDTNIIHLHWINFGFLSINSIKKLGETGKPIVWTLHDMWAFTGGCHHSGECENYQIECGNCTNFLKNPDENDLSNQIWNVKKKSFSSVNLTIVTCSQWLGNRAQKSSLFKDLIIKAIPNPIDIQLFNQKNKKESIVKLNLKEDKNYILFAAMNALAIGKGYQYLKQAVEILVKKIENPTIELLIFGKANQADFANLPLKVNFLGQLTDQDQIINAYNAASVFVIPSLEENLPNTIMEAMACGTPVVGFEVGGIPEMIDHKKTGYLAKYKDAEDLAAGIYHVLYEADYEVLSKNARQKVVENYAEEVVARQYENLYKSLLQ